MNILTRRHLLQGAAGALGAIGLSQLSLTRRATRYGRVLAQSTPRKVALLIGVNDYVSNQVLQGSLNDIQLQRQLLIHRFGFADADVHLLENSDATRQGIIDAYSEYLHGPAQDGDVIVLHYSGHGDRVRESDRMAELLQRLQRQSIDPDQDLNTAIVPHGYQQNGADAVEDIMGHTLLLMRAALLQKTPNVTFVLDCCYAGGGKRGNVVMRSLNSSIEAGVPSRRIADSEAVYQQKLLRTLNWNDERFVKEILSPQGQGIFVGAARSYQRAADYQFNEFTAGAFTYLLTQYLWHETGPLTEVIPAVSSSSTRLSEHSQAPIYDPKPEAVPEIQNTPIYHIEPVSRPAEALVLPPDLDLTNNGQKNTGDARVRLWLGGLDPWTLEAFDQGSVFSVIDKETGEELGQVQQIDSTRRGLITEGRLINIARGIQATDLTDQLLQERIRGIPEVVTLNVGLDDTLTDEETQTAINVLGEFSSYEVFPVRSGKIAHVLLGRYTQEIDNQLLLNRIVPRYRQTVGSLGLFSPAQAPILVDSFGPTDELMSEALQRLRHRFTSLHIGRMLALMVNQQASNINVSVSVDHRGSRSGTTTRGGDPADIIIPEQSERGIEQVPYGHEVAVTVKNHEAYPLHFGLIVIDGKGDVSVLFPPPVDEPNIDVISGGGSSIQELEAAPPYGIAELLVLASPQSLRGPLNTLRRQQPRRGENINAAAVMEDIFSAMSTQRSGSTVDKIEGPRLLDVEQVAVLSLLFEILPDDA